MDFILKTPAAPTVLITRDDKLYRATKHIQSAMQIGSYNYLQELDIIYNQRGIGFFITEKGFENTKQLQMDNFINEQLPRIFHQMHLLGMERLRLV